MKNISFPTLVYFDKCNNVKNFISEKNLNQLNLKVKICITNKETAKEKSKCP